MYEREKSDSLIVAAKANNPKGAESVERSEQYGNAEQPHMRRTQSREHSCHRGCHAGGSCKAVEERTVYSIVPPADSRRWKPHSSPEQEKRPPEDGIRWMDYAGNMKNNNRSAPRHQGSYSGAARQASLHPKSGWKTTPLGIAFAGGQDRPVCAGENPNAAP